MLNRRDKSLISHRLWPRMFLEYPALCASAHQVDGSGDGFSVKGSRPCKCWWEAPASWPVSCLRAPPQGRSHSAALRSASAAPMALRATLDPGRSSTGEKRAGGPGKRGPGWGAPPCVAQVPGVTGASAVPRTPGRLSGAPPVALFPLSGSVAVALAVGSARAAPASRPRLRWPSHRPASRRQGRRVLREECRVGWGREF